MGPLAVAEDPDEDSPLLYDSYMCRDCFNWDIDWRHPFMVDEWGVEHDVVLPPTYAEMEAAGQLRLFEAA